MSEHEDMAHGPVRERRYDTTCARCGKAQSAHVDAFVLFCTDAPDSEQYEPAGYGEVDYRDEAGASRGCQAESPVGYACVRAAGHRGDHRDEAGNVWPIARAVSGHEVARLRRFEDAVTAMLGPPVEGTDAMIPRLRAKLAGLERNRWSDRVKLLEQRADLARRVLAGERIDRHPLVLRAAADAVQERAHRWERDRAFFESDGAGDGAVEFAGEVASELRRIERELREEGGDR